MRLLSLEIKNYKNINSMIDFSKGDGISLIVGTNGSGKSNLLEVLSAIFSAVYNDYNDETNVKPEFSFNLIYTIYNKYKVKICNDGGKISIYYNDIDNEPNKLINKKDKLNYLPEHVIAIYSGEEMRMWENYYKDFYLAFNKQYRRSKGQRNKQRMIYFNHYYWNLIASILSIHSVEEHKKYLSDDIGLKHIAKIDMEFDVAKIKGNKNIIATEIIKYLNPDNKEKLEIDINKYAEIIDICGSEDEMLLHMIVLVLSKQYKIIKDFRLVCDDNIQLQDLSEGEKKILLLYGAINITVGENLYLFDEPDAHLHEGRKNEIYDLIHSDEKSQFVITSHSPTMTQMFSANNVLFAQKEKGIAYFISKDASKIISDITNDEWKYINQTLYYDNKRILVLTEGYTDIVYIKKVFGLFKTENDNYKIFDNVDFLPCGGADNVRSVFDEIREKIPKDKKIIILFDRDDGGASGLEKIIAKKDLNINNEKIVIDDTIYKVDSTICMFLPAVNGNSKNSMIEDYFSIDLKKNIAKKQIYDCSGYMNGFVNMKTHIKNQLKNKLKENNKDIFNDFKVLLNKMVDVIEEKVTFKKCDLK